VLDRLEQLFLMTWLWSIFAGFYLVAYAFWVPNLSTSLPLVVLGVAVCLALGGSLLVDGFFRAAKLQSGTPERILPIVRARQVLGGLALLAFLSVYLPPSGGIVAHWPLDLAITLVSGVIMLAYGVAGETGKDAVAS
jgi:hypothetical protein